MLLFRLMLYARTNQVFVGMLYQKAVNRSAGKLDKPFLKRELEK